MRERERGERERDREIVRETTIMNIKKRERKTWGKK